MLRNLSTWFYGVAHALIAAIAFLLPVILGTHPEWANLTIGAVLVGIVNWLEAKTNT